MAVDDHSLRQLAAAAARNNVARLEHPTLNDVEGMRPLLRGAPGIDLPRLRFRDPSQVDRFLGLHEFDLTNADDGDRLEELRGGAVEYLARNFGYRIPEDVA